MLSRVFIVLMGQSVAAGFLLWMISGWTFPFTTDSMIYISAAQNIARFKGIVFTNFFVQPSLPDFLPMSLAPPGFPICIAILKWAGINEYASALMLPRVCCLFLPFLFYYVFRRFFSGNALLIASGMCSLTFFVLASSVIAWSDTPYLALSLLVLIMVFHVLDKKSSVHWSFIVMAGVLSGTAFLMRFVGTSLIVSIGTCLLLGTALRIILLKDFVRIACLYGIGVFLPVFPYCMRNLTVFGHISMAPQTVSKHVFLSQMVIVVRLYFQGLSTMIFGTGRFAWVLPIVMACFIFWFILRAKDLMKEHQVKFICLLLLLLYFFIYSFFLIYNKSCAFLPGNPDINERLMMQLSWILLGGGVFAAQAVLKRPQGPKETRIFVMIGVLVFVLIQIFPAVGFYQKQTEIRALARNISQYFPAKGIPDSYVIVSNVPEITYFFAKRNVRGLGNYTPHGLLAGLGVDRDFVVFLVKRCGHLSPAWRYADEWKTAEGYKRAYSDEQVDLLVPVIKYHRTTVKTGDHAP